MWVFRCNTKFFHPIKKNMIMSQYIKYSSITLSRTIAFLSLFTIVLFINCDRKEGELNQSLEITNQDLDSQEISKSPTICTICDKEFYGNGYEEQMDGSYKELSNDYQGFVCSPTCGREATNKIKKVASKYGIDLKESVNSKCERCSGFYEDGFCNICGGASPERENESNQNKASCEMCQGDKYIELNNGVKLCPVCEGTGKQSY